MTRLCSFVFVKLLQAPVRLSQAEAACEGPDRTLVWAVVWGPSYIQKCLQSQGCGLCCLDHRNRRCVLDPRTFVLFEFC